MCSADAYEARHAEDEAEDERPESARLVDARPEEREHIHGAHGRRDEGGHILNVSEELAATLHDGDPRDTEYREHHNEDSKHKWTI